MHVLSFQDALRRDSVALDDVFPTVALQILWRAHRYAIQTDMDAWDFAVEIDEFHRAQISNSDLRWLLSQNLIKHADESAFAGGKRQFRRTPSTSLNEKSCFIIAEAGLQLLETLRPTEFATRSAASTLEFHAAMRPSVLNSNVAIIPPSDNKPSWDAQRRELRVGGQVVKHFRRPAPNQQLILDLFQSAQWPTHLVDPLPLRAAYCPKRRLHDAIKRLNRHHRQTTIRFRGDGSGRGVLWELVG